MWWGSARAKAAQRSPGENQTAPGAGHRARYLKPDFDSDAADSSYKIFYTTMLNIFFSKQILKVHAWDSWSSYASSDWGVCAPVCLCVCVSMCGFCFIFKEATIYQKSFMKILLHPHIHESCLSWLTAALGVLTRPQNPAYMEVGRSTAPNVDWGPQPQHLLRTHMTNRKCFFPKAPGLLQYFLMSDWNLTLTKILGI